MLGYKALAKLGRKKYREQYNAYLVEGKKTVLEAIEAKVAIIQLVATNSFKQEQPEYYGQRPIQKYVSDHLMLELGRSQFSEITDTTTPQGIAAVIKLPEFNLDTILAGPKRTIAILEDIRDPGNLGTIIRTADWFGFDGLICLGGADPYQPKVVRSSMGSIFRMPIIHYGRSDVNESLSDLFAKLKDTGFKPVVTKPKLMDEEAPRGAAQVTDLSALREAKVCLVFGNEAHGTSQRIDQLAESAIAIPGYGGAESLNVAISFGILAAWRRIQG